RARAERLQILTAADPDAAVCRRDANGRAARSDCGANLTTAVDRARDGDGEVDADPAVDRSGFELDREVGGESDPHAAVGRLDIHPGSLPAVATELDPDPAV